MKSAFIR